MTVFSRNVLYIPPYVSLSLLGVIVDILSRFIWCVHWLHGSKFCWDCPITIVISEKICTSLKKIITFESWGHLHHVLFISWVFLCFYNILAHSALFVCLKLSVPVNDIISCALGWVFMPTLYRKCVLMCRYRAWKKTSSPSNWRVGHPVRHPRGRRGGKGGWGRTTPPCHHNLTWYCGPE